MIRVVACVTVYVLDPCTTSVAYGQYVVSAVTMAVVHVSASPVDGIGTELVADVLDVVFDQELPPPWQLKAFGATGSLRLLKLSENPPTLTSYLVPLTAAVAILYVAE